MAKRIRIALGGATLFADLQHMDRLFEMRVNSFTEEMHGVVDVVGDLLRRSRKKIWYELFTGKYLPTDHTLEELRQMDHPYARRHGTIQAIHDPVEAIHMQSSGRSGKTGGGISIFKQIAMADWSYKNRKVYAIVFTTEEARRIWKFLRAGTTRMLPRDLFGRIVQDHRQGITTEVKRAVERYVRKMSRNK